MIKALICLFCFPVLLQAQLPRLYDPQNGIFRFNGKVKSCKETEFAIRIVKNDTIKTRRKQNPIEMDFLVTFNPKGKVIEQVYYEKNDKIKKTRRLLYDQADQLIRETTADFRDSLIRSKIVSHFYNSNGQLQKTEKELRDSSLKTKQVNLSSSEEVVIYDSLKRKKEVIYTGVEDVGRMTFNYSGTGDLVEEKQYSPAKKQSGTTTYTYDQEHRCIEMKETGASNYKMQFKYAQNEFPTEQITYRDNRLIDKQVYKRDQYNNKTEAQYYKANKESYTLTFEFEYDANGNWIRKTTFIDKRLIYIAERSFEYY